MHTLKYNLKKESIINTAPKSEKINTLIKTFAVYYQINEECLERVMKKYYRSSEGTEVM